MDVDDDDEYMAACCACCVCYDRLSSEHVLVITSCTSVNRTALAKPRSAVSAVAEVLFDKSSAVAEIGDRSHNRHGPKRGRELGSCLVQCGLGRGLLP